MTWNQMKGERELLEMIRSIRSKLNEGSSNIEYVPITD